MGQRQFGRSLGAIPRSSMPRLRSYGLVFDVIAAHGYTAAGLAPHIVDFAHLLLNEGNTDWRDQRDAE